MKFFLTNYTSNYVITICIEDDVSENKFHDYSPLFRSKKFVVKKSHQFSWPITERINEIFLH